MRQAFRPALGVSAQRLLALLLVATVAGGCSFLTEEAAETATPTTNSPITFTSDDAAEESTESDESEPGSESDDADASQSITTTTQSATSSESTTTTAGETTTTISTTTTTAAPRPVADGSGCTPGDGLLPNGHWFGYAETARADSLDFDLACRFSNEQAALAQVEDGEGPDVYDDYYIRNNNPALRTLLIDPDVPVIWYPNGDPATETMTTYADWINQQSFYKSIWVTVEGGQVSAIAEQWAP